MTRNNLMWLSSLKLDNPGTIKRLGLNRIDLHGYRKGNAFDLIAQVLDRFHRVGYHRELFIIHGHHGGTVLRDYIRSKAFKEDLTRIHPWIKDVQFELCGDGATHLTIIWGEN